MKNNYTFSAIRIAHKYPLLSNIIKQAVFWILSYSLLLLIIHYNTASIINAVDVEFHNPVISMGVVVILAGLILGFSLGLIDAVLAKNQFKNMPLGISILIGGVLYFIVLMLVINFIRFFLLNYASQLVFDEISIRILEDNWKYYNYILMAYSFFMTLVISFVNQMNKRFGPGILIPLLFGRYRYPREEERIFMFMDLTSSTKLAERLGHLKYSALIQDSFLDINRMVKKYNAEIYQYVGDEIVVSWPLHIPGRFSCIDFFFAVQEQLQSRKEYYLQRYGITPHFKAGVHAGIVTAVEVGDVKRDIAYHGDTLNVAARIEGLCKIYNESILISGTVNSMENIRNSYLSNSLGYQELQGRENPVEIFSIEKRRI
ncbi:adenylate/guanylate cyclase domain-containing protein [Autumnicola musiva]|uniref:Adenylate/guanylate cyclase domain-containing protein n=1 Tax=Autumnicola musiva TaxID=3075589 RepID=A0ABU3D4H1_9FLAO|nr:adenylate/guanylate cyclase domain-containing protein [Zunongwangia sp. F117]MDT0676404.1 adenylate/guanylate cyclase domain-containing protein [Zunongwangia sp. F117]